MLSGKVHSERHREHLPILTFKVDKSVSSKQHPDHLIPESKKLDKHQYIQEIR